MKLHITWLILCTIILTACKTRQTAALPFQDAIDKFKTEDALVKNKEDVILFTGSSSFTFWKGIKQDLGCKKIVNRGFGGSSLTDLINHRKVLFRTYSPKQIFIYCGENDLASNDRITPIEVLERWKILHSYIRKKNKKCPVYFISLKPSPSRWHLRNEMMEVNKLIKAYNASVENTFFIDIWPYMITPSNVPKPEIFLKDSLHMNNNGYDIWVDHLVPKLDCN
jgi:lysophospholipase L1-like esterase